MPTGCSVDGCDRKHFSRGFCNMHYQRWRKSGDAGTATPQRVRLPDRTCIVEGCTTPLEAHGLCVKHLRRRATHGDVDTVLVIHDNDTRFESRIARQANGCWLWTGPVDNSGYARGYFDGVRWLVHRWAYQRWVAPIPAGLVIDHLCRQPICCNPAHLEAVTQAENIARTFLPPRRLPT